MSVVLLALWRKSIKGSKMNRDKTITLARAVRSWKRSIAEVTLVWRPFYSKLGVEYREESYEHGDRFQTVPDWCVKNWLWTFIRPQDQLQDDSYHITQLVSYEWRNIIVTNALPSC